ncbi:MAG TPA: DinB family protein [Anaerolineales bacterium]|jgi:fructoselysine-6-P-deglycase FrlB-like protein
MEELLAYRRQLVDRMEKSVEKFCAAVRAAAGAAPSGEGWNVHQLAVHTRDGDKLVYGLRVYRTAQEPNPLFEDFDQDAWMAAQYDANEPLEHVLEDLSGSVHKLAAWLREAPAEAWSRESRHAVMGSGFTMQTWAERGLAHLEGHLEEIERAGAESKKEKAKRKK